MLCHLNILITIFSIIFVKAILADPSISDCDIPCKVNDANPVCGFDKQEICFMEFPSKCIMERYACIFERDYEVYADAFCDIQNFLCANIPIQSPPLEENDIEVENKNETATL